MYNSGLIDETREVLERNPESGALLEQIIGYAEALQFLRGEIGESEAMELTAKATRSFAKRQATWFRRMRDMVWLNLETVSARQGMEVVLSALNK